MKRFIEGADRDQSPLFPERLDDFIAENNPVRVVEAYVEALDLSALGFASVNPHATGRPAYHPSVLLKLYISGYPLDLASTLRKFEDVDWQAELAMEKKLVESGDANCPPGLGIVHSKDRILHICPNPSGALVHFHYLQKVIGLFSRQKSLTLENVRPDQIKSFIHAFFDQDWEVIEGYT